MQEQRHWIIDLPAILVLAPAVALFPFSFFCQPQSGFEDPLRQLRRPARMLISSSGVGEGAWIAMASLAEQRTGSMIVRASKALAEEGWNGTDYRLLTPTVPDVSRRLDELVLDTIQPYA